MGLIKAFSSAIGGSLADQWLEVIEPNDMGEGTVFTTGVKVRKDDRRGSNKRGLEAAGSNEGGSALNVVICHNPLIISNRLKGEFKPNKLIPFSIDKNSAVGSSI